MLTLRPVVRFSFPFRSAFPALALLLSVLVRPATAELHVSAWLLVVHEAATESEASAWATEQCTNALAPWCGEAWADGTLGEGVGIYAAEDWPGAEGGPWLVGAGVVRSRNDALALRSALQDAGLTVQAARIQDLPHVQQWAQGIAGQWRLWTQAGTASGRQVLYLSRDGQDDLMLAEGWPLPQDGQTELYAIGRSPDAAEADAFYYFANGAVRRVDTTTGTVSQPEAADAAIADEALAALVELAGPDTANVELQWALPFAAAALAEGADDRPRFLLLRRGASGWSVLRDEVRAP